MYSPDILPSAMHDALSEFAVELPNGVKLLKPPIELDEIIAQRHEALFVEGPELAQHIAIFGEVVVSLAGDSSARDLDVGVFTTLGALERTALPTYKQFVRHAGKNELHADGVRHGYWPRSPQHFYRDFERRYPKTQSHPHRPVPYAREAYDSMQPTYRRVGYAWILASAARMEQLT